jgi:hypothetical protein
MSEINVEVEEVEPKEDDSKEEESKEVESLENINCVLNESENNTFYNADYLLNYFDFDTSDEDEDINLKGIDLVNGLVNGLGLADLKTLEDDDTDFDQLSLFNMNGKQLSAICEYYDFPKRKLKKQEQIEQILLYESNDVNKNRVSARYKFWDVMNLLKNNKKMKKYIIWP